MRGHEQRDDPLQEGLGGSVVAEEGVPVDVVEVAILFRWTAGLDWGHISHVEAEQLVQPVFDGISWSVSKIIKNWIFETIFKLTDLRKFHFLYNTNQGDFQATIFQINLFNGFQIKY